MGSNWRSSRKYRDADGDLWTISELPNTTLTRVMIVSHDDKFPTVFMHEAPPEKTLIKGYNLVPLVGPS